MRVYANFSVESRACKPRLKQSSCDSNYNNESNDHHDFAIATAGSALYWRGRRSDRRHSEAFSSHYGRYTTLTPRATRSRNNVKLAGSVSTFKLSFRKKSFIRTFVMKLGTKQTIFNIANNKINFIRKIAKYDYEWGAYDVSFFLSSQFFPEDRSLPRWNPTKLVEK